MAASRLCAIPNCGKAAAKRGWCGAHYLKWYRHGDPLFDRCRRKKWLDRYAVTCLDGDRCLVFPFSKLTNGYAPVSLGDNVEVLAHRYVCEKAHGAPPSPEHETAHSCGNRPCVNRWHLRWATKVENAADRMLHGTDPRGERNGHAKLTRADVDEIVSRRGTETGRSLAARFGVTPTQISNIQLRKQWFYPT